MPQGRLRIVVILLAFLSTPAFAQSVNSTTGGIVGTVHDRSGGDVSTMEVTAANVATGLKRTTATDVNGRYALPLLPPGRYRVYAMRKSSGVAEGYVTVLLGNTAALDFDLAPQASETITVRARASVIDVRQSGLVASVTDDQIDNLPILGRDFRDLALLSPGAVAATGDRVAFNGARGITSNYNVDGADMNSDFFGEQRGGTVAPFTLSQAAIREFQVIRSAFSAESAKGVGGTLNAVTKSGTNEFSGQVFFYLRRAGWASARPALLDGLPVTDTFQAKDVDQYGFAFGGPIVRDRIHFFINADIQDFNRLVTPNDFRSAPGFVALPTHTRTQFVGRVEQFLGYPVDREFSFESTEDEEARLAKVDANFGSTHHASLRANSSNFTNVASEGTRTFSNNGVLRNDFVMAVVQVESVLSSAIVNQAILQLSREERPRLPANSGIPHTQLTGAVPYTFGQLEFLPGNVTEHKWQFKDSISIASRRHRITSGFELTKVDLDNTFPRRLAGQYTFGSVQDFLDGRPGRFQQGMGPEGATPGQNRFDYRYTGIFVNDTLDLGRLILDLGVRYDYQTMPRPASSVAPEYADFIDNFRPDTDNVGPRIGFAYDIDGRSILRGGVGRYYDFLPAILLADPTSQISGLYTTISVNCSASTPCPVYPNIYTRTEFGRFAQAARDIKIIGREFEAQEATRTSLGWERQVRTAFGIAVDATFARLGKQQSLVNVNAIPTGLVFGDMPQYRLNNPSTPDPAARYARFQTVSAHTSDAEATYKAVSLSVKRLPSGGRRLSWFAHYTWSEAIDQDSNERGTNASGRIDPFNPTLNEGHADYDVTHKFVVSGVYELPFNVVLSKIVNWRTGIPWTATISGFGNGLADLGISTPMFVDGEGTVVDMRAASGMSNQQVAGFLAARGARLDARNSQRQPSVFNVDVRVSKRFIVRRNLAVELLGEVFNLMNTRNRFVPVANRNRYTASQQNGLWSFTPNERFGKTNAYNDSSDPRHIQLAMKIHF